MLNYLGILYPFYHRLLNPEFFEDFYKERNHTAKNCCVSCFILCSKIFLKSQLMKETFVRCNIVMLTTLGISWSVYQTHEP